MENATSTNKSKLFLHLSIPPSPPRRESSPFQKQIEIGDRCMHLILISFQVS